MTQVGEVSIQYILIECVLMIPAFFFGFDKSGFRQYFYMMRNRRLSEINHILDFGALTTTALVRNEMKNLEAIGVSQCLRNFLHLFDR